MVEGAARSVAYSDDALDLRAAARDLLPGTTLEVALRDWVPTPPARVWWPAADDEVAAVLAQASAEGRPVVPFGAGSGVCGGVTPTPEAWVVDTKRLDAIGPVDAETWTVEVEAGVNGQALEDALAAQGFTLGHSPSSLWCSTVGGWAAARGAGQFSSWYGVFEDMVLGLDGVAPGVGPFSVGLGGRHARAPDAWMPLLLGSEGSLAVFTRFRLRVRPLPEARELRGFRFRTMAEAVDAMRRLLQGDLWPSVLRLYDPIDTLIGGRTRPEKPADAPQAWWKALLARVDALPAVRRRTLALPLAVPGLVRRLADGLAGGVLLIVGFEGQREVVAAAADAAWPVVQAAGGEDLGPGPGERWFASRHHVSYKSMGVLERGGFVDTMEVAARWSLVLPVYEAVRRAAGARCVVMCHLSHAYPEGCSLYFSFAGPGSLDAWRATWGAALVAALQAGATATHHHGVGRLKARAAAVEAGAARRGWEALKAELDPAGVLNPGVLYAEDPRAWPSAARAPEAGIDERDGLVRVSREDVGAAETRWGWSGAGVPPRWARDAWMSGVIEVRGEVDGAPVVLGRAPRSAAGPDLRGWVLGHGTVHSVTLGALGDPRQMVAGRVEAPWAAVRALLRADLRPARVGVLHVGFAGPAASAFAALACAQVPELSPVAWRDVRREVPGASGWEPCSPDDPRAVAATSERVWRAVVGEEA